ncbi:hypothetical protein RND71_015335 [Anisodus tanguticus]|uniref:Thioredoxin domain-containing protein n=1 Tax=Anisodus tanguticus TaxID=243964 RepID=A0AAE1S6Y4_9SOLA|nr:hypothetical protein RND71_015335 [Anisodus tanguticus]
MSGHKKPISDMGIDSLDDNKPDFKELDLGSPVSPLLIRISGLSTTTTTTSSSSSSSGSVSGRNVSYSGHRKSDSSHSGELSGPRKSCSGHSGELSGSVESSPTTVRGFKRGHGRPSSGTSSSSSGSVSGRNVSYSGHSGELSGPRKSDSGHSGELAGSVESSPTTLRGFKPGYGRPDSGPLIYSGGGSSVSSPAVNVLPAGNICRSGNIVRTGMASKPTRTNIVGSGTGNYGHGSIMRGGPGVSPNRPRPDIASSNRPGPSDASLNRPGPGGTYLSRPRHGGASTRYDGPGPYGVSSGSVVNSGSSRGLMVGGGGETVRRVILGNDPEELKRIGNENYKKGNFVEALNLYDKAIAISPGNATLHFNRAAALIGLKRLGEAVRECEEAIRLDPSYVRAHQRLGSLLLRTVLAYMLLLFPLSHFIFLDTLLIRFCSEKFVFIPFFPSPLPLFIVGSFPPSIPLLNLLVSSWIVILPIPYLNSIIGHKPDQAELQKLQAVEKNISKCTASRRLGDWTSTLKEAEASPQLLACRAEAYLKLHQLADAELCLSKVGKYEPSASACQSKIFGMLSEAYIFFVHAQIDMALGRFESAVTAIERAAQVDPRSAEVSLLLKNVRLVGRARTRGNDLFKSERYTEACAAYGEGLTYNSSNSVLYCNRAACWYKLEQWEKSLDDCNQALLIQPNYTKALLRRAASNAKLERWSEAVRDYEVLRRELPYDNEVAESLFHAQVALKESRGEDVSNMKFGGEVELVLGLEQFRSAISSSGRLFLHPYLNLLRIVYYITQQLQLETAGASVVHFKAESNLQCKQISPFLDTLSTKFPSISFVKVDVGESPAIATAENVRIVPTFKIYKNGSCMKEMIRPSPEVLKSSVRHYSF